MGNLATALAPRWHAAAGGERITAALFSGAALTVVVAKLLSVYRDHSVTAPMDNYPVETLAAAQGGFAVLLLLALVAWLATALPGSLRRLLLATIMFATIVYVVLTIANVVTLVVIGSHFDLSWASYIAPRNMEALGTYMATAISPQMQAVIVGLFALFAGAAIAAGRWLRPSAGAVVLVLATLFASGWVATRLSVEPGEHPLVKRMRAEPVAHFVRQERGYRALRRAAAAQADIGDRDWRLALPPDTSPLAIQRPNVILITIDSVARKALDGAFADRDDLLPNFARLARSGVVYRNAYATYPASSRALISTLTGIHTQPNAIRGDSIMLRDRDVDTMTEALGRGGYRTALFMSGELGNYGVSDFLDVHRVDRRVDNRNLRCREDRRERARLYNHPGDDCLARAAMDWALAPAAKPHFLWVWMNGTHHPYFSTRNAFDRSGTPAARARNALIDVDAALGIVIERLERAGRLESTLLIVTSDHGEAFGEHGVSFHGTNIFDEQVNVPLVLHGAGVGRLARTPGPVSQVDLAPTILHLVGAAPMTGMQGRSLFDRAHPRRAYFSSRAGGLQLGYREGDRKFVYDVAADRLDVYDLKRDPAELAPVAIDEALAETAKARLGAFLRYRSDLAFAPDTGVGRNDAR
ncbi:sulfatase [Sphingomonas baiyangensis]|uniref:Sulfatase n=1 Tax=Sphingomonas baiyangensis TaxID=2572576 RepID=A0A4V5PYF8_9SPHN|nr:sulfatase [Sphingomonas baiyangensis]TKD50968.1 sulfatase [Sphingomonas baiyangensis]